MTWNVWRGVMTSVGSRAAQRINAARSVAGCPEGRERDARAARRPSCRGRGIWKPSGWHSVPEMRRDVREVRVAMEFIRYPLSIRLISRGTQLCGGRPRTNLGVRGALRSFMRGTGLSRARVLGERGMAWLAGNSGTWSSRPRFLASALLDLLPEAFHVMVESFC